MSSSMSTSRGPDEPTVAVGAEATRDARVPEPTADLPSAIGRYRVQFLLGLGGTGAVYAAHDPRLDRSVAIKVPRRARRSAFDETARARLIREAQALAAVVHPNVVEIYDVGNDDVLSGDDALGVYIVMERLEGSTLRTWMRERHPWREVIDVFVAAGRGLSAAHEQRLLHRDFKPENVMLTTDGRVKVLDFGLARAAEGTPSTGAVSSSEFAGECSEDLTETGIVMGTPRYMAPEQHVGRKVTPAADQYAFCAAMLEALQGFPVFAGRTIAELHAAKRSFRPGAGSVEGVPGWLRTILERGLAQAPEERWPSMARLLAAIERGTRSGRRKMTWLGGVALVGLGVAWWPRAEHEDGCSSAASNARDVWNESRSRAMRRVFASVDARHGPNAAEQLVVALDARAALWSELHVRSCEAHRREQIDARVFDRRMQCLRARRAELEALVELLMAADAELVLRAVELPGRLAPLDGCIDDESLEAGIDPPSDPREAELVREVEDALARIEALFATYRAAQGLEQIEALRLEIAQLDHAPTRLAVDLKRAEALVALGRPKEALPVLETVLFESESSGYDTIAMRSMLPLLFALGQLGRTREAIDKFPQALALIERAHASPWIRARLVGIQAFVLFNAGRLTEARPLYEEAIAQMEAIVGVTSVEHQTLMNNYGSLLEKLGDIEGAVAIHRRTLEQRMRERGEDHPALLAPLTNLGAAHLAGARYAESVEWFERAIEVSEANHGRRDPQSHHAWMGLGVALKKMGRYAEAIERYEHALELVESTLGDEHPTTAMLLANIANAKKRLGDDEAALELHRRALAIRERVFGSEHKDLVFSHRDIASIMLSRGQLDEARRHIAIARSIVEKLFGLDHPELASVELFEGMIERDAGAWAEASAHFERATELIETHLGPEHGSLGNPLYELGSLRLERGQAADAAPLLRRCIAVWESSSASPGELGSARFALARAEWSLGEHVSALDHAALAAAAFESATPPDERHAEVTAWLTARTRAGNHGGSTR